MMSPAGKTSMRSPRVKDSVSAKKGFMELELCQENNNIEQLIPGSEIEESKSSPKIDPSKFRLLKSPKTTQPQNQLKELVQINLS